MSPPAPCFTQKTGVSSAACLLPEKLKTIGSKELSSQMQGMLSTCSMTYWSSTGCLQLKYHHSSEKKEKTTLLGGSDYADSKKHYSAAHCPRTEQSNCLGSGPQAKNLLPK